MGLEYRDLGGLVNDSLLFPGCTTAAPPKRTRVVRYHGIERRRTRQHLKNSLDPSLLSWILASPFGARGLGSTALMKVLVRKEAASFGSNWELLFFAPLAGTFGRHDDLHR